MTDLIRYSFIWPTPRNANEDFFESRCIAILVQNFASYFDRSSGCDDASLAEKENPVAHPLDLMHVVRGVEDRCSTRFLQIEQNLSHLDSRLRIKVSGRLVEQQQFRIVQKCFAEPDAGDLARGQLRHRFFLQSSDPEFLQQLVDFHRGVANVVDSSEDPQILQYSQANRKR